MVGACVRVTLPIEPHAVAGRRGRRMSGADHARPGRSRTTATSSTCSARTSWSAASGSRCRPTGDDAIELFERSRPDLALIDLMLPRADGFDLCQQIRAASTIGIIVLSARGRRDRQGAGAQPRRRRLPHQAVRHRRAAGPHPAPRCGAAAPRPAEARSPAGHHAPATSSSTSTRSSSPLAGEAVRLTPTEFALLREFALNPGHRRVATPRCSRRVWGPGYATETEYTRVYVRRLRAKLEPPGGRRSSSPSTGWATASST